MSLQRSASDGGLRVRWVREQAIEVAGEQYQQSVLLLPDSAHPGFVAGGLASVDSAAIDRLIALKPDLLLLGTGPRLRFLSPMLQARLLGRGIGVECMDSAAAARTFNLLADEARRVAALFLFEAAVS